MGLWVEDAKMRVHGSEVARKTETLDQHFTRGISRQRGKKEPQVSGPRKRKNHETIDCSVDRSLTTIDECWIKLLFFCFFFSPLSLIDERVVE